MKKFVCTIVFVMLVFALNFFCADIKTIVAEEVQTQELTYFLEKPKSEYVLAYPYYIVKGNFNEFNCVGKSYSFNYDQNVLNTILCKFNAVKVKTEIVNGVNVSCYYSDVVSNSYNSICLNEKKVNLQVAIRGEKVVVGIPLILGSF